MKHRGIVVPVFLLLVVLWLFVGARPIRLELSMAPTWIDVNGSELAPGEVGAPGLRTAAASGLSSVPSDDARPPVSFLLDGTLFYVDPAAGVAASHQIPEFVAAGSEAFIGYSGVAENHLLQRPDGEIVGRVAVSGAPFVVNDRFFVVAPFQDGGRGP